MIHTTTNQPTLDKGLLDTRDNSLNVNDNIPKYKEKQSDDIQIDRSDKSFNFKLDKIQEKLKSSSVEIVCPYCGYCNKTKTERSISYLSATFCLLGLFIVPICIQLCRKKDLNCMDCDHYCSSCMNKLKNYRSMC